MSWLTDTIIGLGDVHSYIWYLWHTQNAIVHLRWNTIFYTNLLFYPYGTPLVYDAPLLNSIVSLPLFIWKGPIIAYNFLILLSFIGTFLGIFLFLNEVVKNDKGAIIGSLGFTFSGYRLFLLMGGQMDLLSMQWMGFCLYFLLKTFHAKTSKWYFAGFVITFLLQAYTDYRTLFFLCLFVIILIGKQLILIYKKKKFLEFLISYIRPFFIIILGMVPFFILYGRLLNISYETNGIHKNIIQGMGSADLAGFIFPYKDKSFLQLGWFSIGILVYLFLRGKNILNRREISFWVIYSVLFLIISLGPKLHVCGFVIPYLMLPFELLMRLPLFKLSHIPYRYIVGVHLGLSVLVSYGVTHIFQNSKNRYVTLLFFYFFIVLSVIQYSLFTYIPLRINEYPGLITQTILSGPSGTVLSIPFGYHDAYRLPKNYDFMYAMFNQIIHQKPLLGGYLSYINDPLYEKYKSNVVMQKIVACQEKEICIPFTETERKYILSSLKVKYIIAEKSNRYEIVLRYLRNQFKDVISIRGPEDVSKGLERPILYIIQ